MKKVAILFTGGLDSTYLVYKNLMEGNIVYLYYIEIENNKNKTKLELKNIERIYKIFEEQFPGKIYESRTIFKILTWENNYNFALIQPPIWVLGISFIQNKNFDEIQIGYVSNDCAISYINDILKLYNSYSPLNDNEKSMIPLTFPLMKYSKEEIMNSLPKIYSKNVYSCEGPSMEYIPCGSCVTCKKYFQIFLEQNRFIDNFPFLVDKEKIKIIKKASSDYEMNKYSIENNVNKILKDDEENKILKDDVKIEKKSFFEKENFDYSTEFENRK